MQFNDEMLGYAQEELHQMRHYYLGIEHILIALLKVDNSIASRYLKEQGYTPDYVIDLIRRKVGKGSKQRTWVGTRSTMRTDRIIQNAEAHARRDNTEVEQRHLLHAVMAEEDSIPIMVLKYLGIDPQALLEYAKHNDGAGEGLLLVTIETEANVPYPNDEQRQILQRMFHRYARVRLERKLTGGYTSAALWIVRPFDHEGRHDASVVVKIDHADSIQDEATRYEQYVKNTLPSTSAFLMDKPVVLDKRRHAGLKYTVIGGEANIPRDLRSVIHEWPPQKIADWIREQLYAVFAPIWWAQNRLVHFQASQEYDRLFPPLFTLEYVPKTKVPLTPTIIDANPNRTRLQTIDNGDVVTVEGYTIRKIDHDSKTLQLAVGSFLMGEISNKIIVRDVPNTEQHYRGEIIDAMSGRVWKTRQEKMRSSLVMLEPDFDPDVEFVPYTIDYNDKFRNPIYEYVNVLERNVPGKTSRIHGDLHLGNIMLGPNNQPVLIDFEKARDGHTLYDWASLEVSLLCDLIAPLAGTSWFQMRKALEYVSAINHQRPLPESDSALAQAFLPILTLRELAASFLAYPNDWSEYYVALSMLCLRAITWESLRHTEEVKAAARLAYLVAGLTMHELTAHHVPREGETQTGDDDTELSTAI